MTRRRSRASSPGSQGPKAQTPSRTSSAVEPGYSVRYAIFEGRAGVFFPTGSDRGSRRRGYPSAPPATYEPPVERVLTTATYELARDLAHELKREHAGKVAVHIEQIETSLPPRRPRQLSMAELADDWPTALPPRRWMGE